MEAAITAITGEEVEVAGSGRTDAGAHALDQVVAFSTTSCLPTDTLLTALNARLPRDIAVVSADEVPDSFHPRFEARSRTYSYLLWNRPVRSPFYLGRAVHVRAPLDEIEMDRALQLLVGLRDVGAFVPLKHSGSRHRRVFRARCERSGHLVTVEIEASGFLRQMVRAIVGTVIRVGTGRLSVEQFGLILESGRRDLAGDTAPAEGLYLTAVEYDTRQCDAETHAGQTDRGQEPVGTSEEKE